VNADLAALTSTNHGGIFEKQDQNYVAQRYDKSHPEGFVDPAYSDIQKEAGTKGMKWGEHHKILTSNGYELAGTSQGSRRHYTKPDESGGCGSS